MVLALVDQMESAVIPHYSISHYPTVQRTTLISKKILCKCVDASEIPRPVRFGAGPDLTIVRTSKGIEGVAAEGDYFRPIQLFAEDVRQYEVSLTHLVDAIRRDSGIEGQGYRNENGLIFVGQKAIGRVGIVHVYLSAPNRNEDSVMARCRRLIGIANERLVALLTPGVLDLSGEDRRVLDRIVTIPLIPAAGEGHLKVDWDEAFGTHDAGTSATAGTTKAVERDLERLIAGKPSVCLGAAARYLERSVGQVQRLLRQGKLTRVGQGRPTQVSTESLRKRKGTPKEPGS